MTPSKRVKRSRHRWHALGFAAIGVLCVASWVVGLSYELAPYLADTPATDTASNSSVSSGRR